MSSRTPFIVALLSFLTLGGAFYFGAKPDLTEVSQLGLQAYARCNGEVITLTNDEYAALAVKGASMPSFKDAPCETAWQEPLYDTPSGKIEEGQYARNGDEYRFKLTRQKTTATSTYTVSEGVSKTPPTNDSVTANDAMEATLE